MKDSYYFQHDSNARNDPKLKALMNTYGLEGYGRFWIIIEMMRESSCYKLEDQAYVWESLAEYCKAELQEVQKFVDDCVNRYHLLSKNEDGSFYSPALLDRMIKLDSIRTKRREAARVRWDES